MQVEASNIKASMLPSLFEGNTFRAVDIRGERHVAARDVGRALGYADDGEQFTRSVNEWVEQGELRAGRHAVRLELRVAGSPARVAGYTTGAVMVRGDGIPGFSPRVQSVVVLTARGVVRCAMLARTDAARRFRDWAEDVLVAEMEGRRLVAPSRAESRLLAAQARQVESETRAAEREADRAAMMANRERITAMKLASRERVEALWAEADRVKAEARLATARNKEASSRRRGRRG